MGSAGLLRGSQATTGFHMTLLLPDVSAAFCDKRVVGNRKIYSAGPAAGTYESALLTVGDIHGDEAARHIERHVLEFRPKPVFGFGTPELAGKLRTAVSRAVIAPLLPICRRRFRPVYEAGRAGGTQSPYPNPG